MMMILFEVKERLGWVEETMEEAIKGLETLTVITDHQSFFYFFISQSFSLLVNDFIFLFDISKRCRRFLQI